MGFKENGSGALAAFIRVATLPTRMKAFEGTRTNSELG
jgi:hypothetical protein